MPYDHVHNRPVSVALVQMSCTEAKRPNVDKAVARIAEAAGRGRSRLPAGAVHRPVFLPERRPSHGLTRPSRFPGPTSEALAAAAKKHGVVVVGSLFERRAPGLYHNTAVVFDADGSQAGIYRKMHIPDDPLYYEKFYFTPGDLGFRSFPTKFGKVGVCVCWDQWYPEAARLTALAGAEIMFYPTAIGWLPRREGGVRREPAQRLGDDDAVARDRQRRVRRRAQSRRPRRRAGVLGRLVRRRSQRQRAGQGRPRTGGDADGRVRPGPDRRGPHALAVLPRPADRRLRRPDQAVSS